MLNLYRISQDINDGWDTFDSAVVVAESEDAARLIHPSGQALCYGTTEYGWVTPDLVTVEYLGPYMGGHDSGRIVCASFNAG